MHYGKELSDIVVEVLKESAEEMVGQLLAKKGIQSISDRTEVNVPPNTYGEISIAYNSSTEKLRAVIEGQVCSRVFDGGNCKGSGPDYFLVGLTADAVFGHVGFWPFEYRVLRGVENLKLVPIPEVQDGDATGSTGADK